MLDRRDVRPAPVSWTTSGLLLDEHVERACALGCACLGSDAGQSARRRCDRRRRDRPDERGGCAVPHKRGADSQWKLGADGRSLHGLGGIAQYTSVNVAVASPGVPITGVSLVLFSLVAVYCISKQRAKLAAVALSVAMIPTGLCMMENVARIAPYFSLANLARFFNGRLDEKGEVLFEGPLNEGSSLIFYLNRKFSLVNQNSQRERPRLRTAALDIFLDQNAVLKKWSQTEAVYLIVEQRRVDHWKSLLTDRFHVFHRSPPRARRGAQQPICELLISATEL